MTFSTYKSLGGPAGGLIVTNNHVVEGSDKVEVTLNDNRNFTARIIGADPSTDLALLKVDEKNLPFITYGNSDELKIGEWVLAVGAILLALLTEEGTLMKNPLARADEVARPVPDPHQQMPPARHPRQVRVIPKSRDFH